MSRFKQGHCESVEELSTQTEVDRLRKLNERHEQIIMDTTNTKSKRVQQFYVFLLLLIISIVFFLALVIWVECFLRAVALEQHQRTFPSAEQESRALLEIPDPAGQQVTFRRKWTLCRANKSVAR